jgi:hypothetical protein
MRESGKETLDSLRLGLEGGWRCLMDGGRLDTGVAKGSLSKELAVVGRVGVVSAVLGRGGMLSSEVQCKTFGVASDGRSGRPARAHPLAAVDLISLRSSSRIQLSV